MYVRRNIKWNIVLRFGWFNLIFFALWSCFVVYIYHHMEHHNYIISIPFQPLSVIGIAVAFYVGFKNNASYDRFWEGRKIWGGIVNYSRTWGNQVMSYLTNRLATENITEEEIATIKQQLIYRHIAWLNALRFQLRQPSSFSIKHPKTVRKLQMGCDPKNDHWANEVGVYLEKEEYEYLIDRRNTATHLIRQQGEQLKELREKSGLIEDFRHIDMMKSLEEFYNLQGKCERIKNTPFPRQYAFFSKVFTWLFILILPFGMVGQFAELNHELMWLTIPFCVIISWIFSTMEIVGDNSEDPFENFINDVPMTALCRTIEIDLREMLGETDLPEKIKPVNDILF